MSSTFNMLVAIAAVCGAAAIVLLGLAWQTRQKLAAIAMAVLALVFMTPAIFLYVLFHPELVDDRFRVYKRLYRDIEIGMTREHVFALVDKYYAEDGRRKRPTILEDTPDDLIFFMNPESSTEPNCEGIFLTMHDGHVVDKEYSPD